MLAHIYARRGKNAPPRYVEDIQLGASCEADFFIRLVMCTHIFTLKDYSIHPEIYVYMHLSQFIGMCIYVCVCV